LGTGVPSSAEGSGGASYKLPERGPGAEHGFLVHFELEKAQLVSGDNKCVSVDVFVAHRPICRLGIATCIGRIMVDQRTANISTSEIAIISILGLLFNFLVVSYQSINHLFYLVSCGRLKLVYCQFLSAHHGISRRLTSR